MKEEKTVQIQKTNPEHQIVKGVVYAAGYVDSDGEAMTAEDVRQAAWNFLQERREKNIDVMHDWKQSGCEVVESNVTDSEDEYFPKDAWVLGVKCTDEIWEKVRSGELNGFSFGGSVAKYPQKVYLEVAKEIVGETEQNLNKDTIPSHEHRFVVYLDDSGNIVKGTTDTTQDHHHTIRYGTATETMLGHSHRVSLEED